MNSVGAEMVKALVEAYQRSLERFENEDDNNNAENEGKEN